MKRLWRGTVIALGMACLGLSAGFAWSEGPPLAELHIWGGNKAGDSGEVGLRSVEAALWPTAKDRVGVRYDNSLNLDNPTLARQGIDAEGYYVSYMHDFDGKFLLQGEVGRRDLPGDSEQDSYKLEGVAFNDGNAFKLGAQFQPTETPVSDFDDTVVWGAYNFAAGERWRLEPALYLSESGALGDREWRAAGYAEYNPPSGKWGVGIGAGFGEVDSDLAAASGEVANAHARLTLDVARSASVHLQVRHEDAPLQDYTVGLVGVSFRAPRG